MIKIRIIPCLDVDNGRVVKGINFINLVDAGDPVKQAKFYSENGADEITFLDITATHEKRSYNFQVKNRLFFLEYHFSILCLTNQKINPSNLKRFSQKFFKLVSIF